MNEQKQKLTQKEIETKIFELLLSPHNFYLVQYLFLISASYQEIYIQTLEAAVKDYLKQQFDWEETSHFHEFFIFILEQPEIQEWFFKKSEDKREEQSLSLPLIQKRFTQLQEEKKQKSAPIEKESDQKFILVIPESSFQLQKELKEKHFFTQLSKKLNFNDQQFIEMLQKTKSTTQESKDGDDSFTASLFTFSFDPNVPFSEKQKEYIKTALFFLIKPELKDSDTAPQTLTKDIQRPPLKENIAETLLWSHIPASIRMYFIAPTGNNKKMDASSIKSGISRLYHTFENQNSNSISVETEKEQEKNTMNEHPLQIIAQSHSFLENPPPAVSQLPAPLARSLTPLEIQIYDQGTPQEKRNLLYKALHSFTGANIIAPTGAIAASVADQDMKFKKTKPKIWQKIPLFVETVGSKVQSPSSWESEEPISQNMEISEYSNSSSVSQTEIQPQAVESNQITKSFTKAMIGIGIASAVSGTALIGLLGFAASEQSAKHSMHISTLFSFFSPSIFHFFS